MLENEIFSIFFVFSWKNGVHGFHLWKKEKFFPILKIAEKMLHLQKCRNSVVVA